MLRHLTASEWDDLANDPEFVGLLRARRAFVLPCTVLFIALFLALPLGVAVAPDVMNAPVAGSLTLAYAYGLFLFIVAWALLAAYMVAAKRFDERARAIVARLQPQSTP